MRFEFTDSADKHDVPRPYAEYAVIHHVDYEILQPRLEVGVAVDGRGRRIIFHAMEVTDLYRHLIPPTDR